jgi:cytochrome c5
MVVRAFLVSLLLALLSGCDGGGDSAPNPETRAEPDRIQALGDVPPSDVEVLRKWAASCALCHVDGNGGAPRIGNADEWAPRLVQGREVLLQHTLEGYNNMPPLGYCMACEREDFLAMIDLMAGER